MKIAPSKSIFACLISMLIACVSQAAQISLITSDTINTSSLTSGQSWAGGQAPQSTNDYFTSTFFMRTPTNNVAGFTFAGNSLTLQPPSGQGAPQRSILFKGPTAQTITINNLTNAGGVINNGGSGNITATFTGNQMTLTANSTILADQGPAIIGYPIVGPFGMCLTNVGSTQSGVHSVSYTGSLSGFLGKLLLVNLNGSLGMVVNLNTGSSNLGNPSSPEPDQITIGLGCSLVDNVGLTFNNPNGGITLIANGSISAASTTAIGEPIVDLTNGVSANAQLTSSGAGTLVLSNANNNYSGGTVVSAGILQLGVDNAIPGNSTNGGVTVNSGTTLDMNGHNATINALNGAGTVDTISGGTPTLTVGANGTSGTFSGAIQNSSGILSFIKTGAGTETLSGTYTATGTTTIAGGALALATASPITPGNISINNAALTIALTSGVNGVNASGSLTLQDNATNNFNFGTVAANPTEIPINVSGTISAPGTNVVITISALGLKTGTFTLIKYTGAALANLANFSLVLPPGVVGTLVNNTGNDSIDVNITGTPNQLSWFGVASASWDLSTPNWSNDISAGITVFQQYTNNGIIAGDSVTFDDTLTNSSPQPTNITLNSTFYAFPVLFNSTLPYSISGTGGIIGTTSLVMSNTGSFTLLTSNSFTGGVSVNGGTLVITNDNALGTNNSLLTLNGGSLQINGSTTNNVRPLNMPVATTVGVGSGANARFGGRVTGVTLSKGDLGTLILGGTNIYSGDLFVNSGTVIIDSGSVTNNNFDSIGQQNTDNGTLTLQGTGTLTESGDFNVGDIGSSVGTLNISGTAKLVAGQLFIASANAASSAAQGTVNQNGGTVTELNQAAGNFVIGGRNGASTLGVGIYNLNSGTLTSSGTLRLGSQGTGTLNQNGGSYFATNGVNIARFAGATGTYNLNGGTLITSNLASSTGVNAFFNFNGGTLKAMPVSQPTWVSTLSQVNIQAGGAFLDDSGNSLTIANALLAGSASGGVTKQGAGTITLTGTNTFTGPTTNNAGTLFLNSPSTYTGAVQINAGTLQISTASILQGVTAIKTNAALAVVQTGSSTATVGNLTFNGAAAVPGAALTVTLTGANVVTVPFINAGTLTLNGTNTINVSGSVPLGATAILQYSGAIAGLGNITNLVLPQGASGYVSNNLAGSTLYVVVTNAGPGLVWTGTNNAAGRTNLWDILSTTNWLVNGKATWYQQFAIPGDAVTFNDSGSGTVLVSNSVGPASLVISNSAKNYSFSGSGKITGTTGVTKLGAGTATINLTNNNYSGSTTISNGTLQIGNAAALSPGANLIIGAGGILQMAGISQTIGDLIGSGLADNNSGIQATLTVGSSSGGTWSGTITNTGAGGLALIKNGSGTWVVGGSNYLNDGQPFTDHVFVNGGTVVITNGGLISIPTLELRIADGNALNSATSSVVVAGGMLVVTNNPLSVGVNSNNANGTLIVNSGTVIAGTGGNGVFAGSPNNIVVGGNGATGTMIVNGGLVTDGRDLWLGQNAGANGTLFLNGGVLQANSIANSGSPSSSIASFNGGTLQAIANNADFLDPGVTFMVLSNGLVLDDGGFTLSTAAGLQAGDGLNGGVIKKGAGIVYFDGGNTYTGTTLVTNGTFAGSGSLSGPLVVAPAGNVFPGDASPSAGNLFTVNGNLTLKGTATFRISVTGGSPANDEIVGVATANYGGTLVVSNVTSDATLITNGQTFQLFSATTGSGNFANIVGSPGAGLSYVFHPDTGVLSVTNAVVKSVPHFTSIHLSGTTLTIAGTNGTPSGQYVLLGTTNVALPVAQWIPLLTNSFDGSGNFNLTTNIIDPTVLREFYLLSQ